jgi:SAM-dependent methyltransferase
MSHLHYDDDLAYIHDQGYAFHANGLAEGLLALLRRRGITDGRVVDLGCGSGIWAGQLAQAGYDVTGIDISSAMIDLARKRVPQGTFTVGSFLEATIPPCRAVTAQGEVVNYLFDQRNSLAALRRVFRKVYRALSSGGLFVFDAAEPGRARGRLQHFSEGPDWICLVHYQHDTHRHRLTRRIITYRQVDGAFRRREKTHVQQLYPSATLARLLRQLGFRVRVVRRLGKYALPHKLAGFICRKA